jgi:hypothetical protein
MPTHVRNAVPYASAPPVAERRFVLEPLAKSRAISCILAWRDDWELKCALPKSSGQEVVRVAGPNGRPTPLIPP